MRAFAYLDLNHPPVAWAVARGMLVSGDQMSESAGPISHMFAGIIEHGNNSRLFNELLIEGVRLRKFPSSVSRLQGMYFFTSRAEALSHVNDVNWPDYFLDENLVEFELYPSGEPTTVDANWITFAPRGIDGRVSSSDVSWIDLYWSKQPYNDVPVWETIATGVAVLLNADVRRRCYDLLTKKFPQAIIPLLMARIAGETGTLGGVIVPWLSSEDEQIMKLAYYYRDTEFHEPVVISKLAEHPDIGTLGALMRDNATWETPDFSPWAKRFRVEARRDLVEGDSSISIHKVPQV